MDAVKDFLGLIGKMALSAAGLLSVVTFTIAMLATGQIGLLVVGWFVIPITGLVWPAILGAWWAGWFYVAVVVGGALASWADDVWVKD